MKRIRLVDLPLIIKIGFAPAFALLMLALMAGGAIVVQKSQSAALKQVVESDMRDQHGDPEDVQAHLERQRRALSDRDDLTRPATSMVGKNDARMAAVLLAETDSVKKELTALKSQAAGRPSSPRSPS
jgi:methyl-accepting chemotaxis protein